MDGSKHETAELISIPRVGDVIRCDQFAHGWQTVDVNLSSELFGPRRADLVTSRGPDAPPEPELTLDRYVVETVTERMDSVGRFDTFEYTVVAARLNDRGQYDPRARRIVFMRLDNTTENLNKDQGSLPERCLCRDHDIYKVGQLTPKVTFE